MDKKTDPRTGNGWRLLLVQSVSCAILILAVLILRLVGGGIFGQLKAYFQQAMRQNALAAAIRALWEDGTAAPSAVADGSGTAPTAASTAVPTASDPTGTGETAAPTAAPTAAVSAPAAAIPVAGAVVTSGFGERVDPFTGESAFHSGLDLAAAEGTAVSALWAGEVVETEEVGKGSLGKYVTVKCENDLEYRCAHLSALFVKAGDRVAAGDRLGAVGHTGRATGSHLHLEIRQEGELRDPAEWLPADDV